jgi:NADH-quinone oxidoreductase subunit A
MTDYITLWPFLVYMTLVLSVAAAMIGISYFLGQRHSDHATGEPYESGIISSGSPHIRFNVKFYLVAVIFVIFDLESVFIYTWAVSIRESGWPGYFLMLLFIFVLATALVYVWRMGILDTGKKNNAFGDLPFLVRKVGQRTFIKGNIKTTDDIHYKRFWDGSEEVAPQAFVSREVINEKDHKVWPKAINRSFLPTFFQKSRKNKGE